MQAFTSSATSINRTKLPAVYGKIKAFAPSVLDYGCGKYTDHIADYLDSVGANLIPYDPYNQPDSVNLDAFDHIRYHMRHRTPLDVVCSNVLNVIDSDGEVSRICNDIEKIATTTGGTAYVTVYEGDRSGIGRQTGKDQYQRNEPLREYLRFFHRATVSHGMIIVKGGN